MKPFAIVFFLFCALGAGAQTITVTGTSTIVLNALGDAHRVSLKVDDHTYSGVPLADLLTKAGAPLGPQLKGKQMTTYVLVRARDGYQVVFALPELDSAFTDRVILLADQADGQPLPTDKGPYRLVVPGEKKHARWIWGVTEIIVKKGD
jgi:DMSO/TMAO reductase YedYZ molybdopterin-dependent catalytic subunit